MATKTAPQPDPLPPADDELRMLPLDRVVPSALNPRKTFDQVGLEQLAASIREHGVIKPIVVRPRTLWQQVVGFVARQRARMDADEPDHGVHRSQFEAAGVKFASESQYDEAIHLLRAEERIQRCKVINADEPGPGAYQPIGADRDRLKTGALHYQIVCGERRWRASKLAGRAVIPAIVRDLDDRLAAEIAVIENDQREDVPPLEQAEGYAELVRLGHDAETIAAKIGRPAKYVVGRLQLTQLTPELKEDLRTGKLPFGHAWVLSRLPADEQRALRGTDEEPGELWEYHDDQVVPLDQLRHAIKREFLGCLSEARWKKDDESLVPAAGACTKCPKRSGANPTLFDELLNGDAKKGRDLCTDRGCYQRKKDAFVQLGVKKSEEANGGQAVKVTAEYYGGGKGVLTRHDYEELSKKDAKSAKPGAVKTAVVVAGPEYGKLVLVKVKKKPAASSTSSSSGSDEKWKREREARKAQAALGEAAAAKANAAAAAHCELLWKAIPSAAGLALLNALRQLAAQLVRQLGWNGSMSVAERRGAKGGKRGGSHVDNLAKMALAMESPAELFGLLGEMIAETVSDQWGSEWRPEKPDDKAMLPFWKALGVDPAKLAKDAEAEAKKAAPAPAQEPAADGKPAKKAKARSR